MNKRKILIPLTVAAMMLPMTASARTADSCCSITNTGCSSHYGSCCAEAFDCNNGWYGDCRPTAQPTARPTLRPTVQPTELPGQDAVVQSSAAAQVLTLVNEYRAEAGVGALRRSAELDRAAAIRAQEIAQLFSHTRPDGSSWSTVSDAAMGENIAKGHRSAEKVMLSWMNSDGHRENILRGSYGSIGIAAVEINGAMYWVQLFGR